MLICSWRCGCNVAIMCNYMSPHHGSMGMLDFLPSKESQSNSFHGRYVCRSIAPVVLLHCILPNRCCSGVHPLSIQHWCVRHVELPWVLHYSRAQQWGPDSPHSSSLPSLCSSFPARSSLSGVDDEEHVPADG